MYRILLSHVHTFSMWGGLFIYFFAEFALRTSVCVCARDFCYLFVCVWLSISSGEVFARGDCSNMCLFHFCMYTLYDIYGFVHFCVYVSFAH